MLARAIVILINLGLLGLMGWGTFQQITTQQETNRVMADVHKNIRQAHRLPVVTNDQLKPLGETAEVVEAMNAKLGNTVNLLARMNTSLANVQASEQKIVQGLDRLNKNTTMVMNQLGNISRQNEQLLASATRTAKQSRSEHNLVEDLYDMTGTTIQQVAKLNRKFAILGKIPVP
jgi:methyl-accepting chemotaxis protein